MASNTISKVRVGNVDYELNTTIENVTGLQAALNAKAGTSVATTSANGLMSSAMVSKLGGIAEGANKTTVDSSLSSSSTNPVQNKVVNSALSGKLATSLKGAANGLAELDANGKVPTSQLPSYVDDVLEYSAKSSFPTTGETGKIYVDTATNKTYRWSGSAYVEISASLALGETSSTAYRGDRGKVAYNHSQTTGNPHGTTKSDLGLGNVENKSSATIRGELTKANVTTALGYTPPTTNTTYSVVSTTANGLAPKCDGSTTKFLRADGTWAVPPDNNTTYSAAGSSLGLVKSGGDVTISSGVITVNDDSHNHTIANVDNLQSTLNGKLGKTTYEYNSELALGGTGKVCIGKFPMYDSSISVEIKSTTSQTYNGTLIIATQNINTTGGGVYQATVYGDADNKLADSIRIHYGSGSNVFSVYINLPGWSKNLLHIQCVALAGAPTDIATTITEIPSNATIIPTNALKAQLDGKVPTSRTVNGKALSSNISLTAADVGALPSSTTIPTVNNATLTIQKNGTKVATFTANSASNATANITVPTGAAADKGVDTSISAASTSTNLPTSKAVAAFVEGKGYKTTDNNTTYTIASGDSNGQIKVTPSSGSAYNVSVKGLGSAAYTNSTAYAPASHNQSASTITSGTLAVARGGTGVTSNPSMLTNLGSTTAASVFAASPRPGVTGTLPIANGGTGATTAAAARTALGAAPASHNQAASTITAGTFAGKVRGNGTAMAAITDYQLRDIKARDTDITAGTTELPTGYIVLVYE